MGFDMEPDGAGGVLFAWVAYDKAYYDQFLDYVEQISIQRIDSSGTVLWGTSGHTVWNELDFQTSYHARVAMDDAGGAYVVTSGGEKTYGQHVDAAGNETWAANGIVLQAASSIGWDVDTNPRIIPDGAGGIFLVQTDYEVYAQRVHIDGTLPWGAAGITAAPVTHEYEAYSGATIDADGFGGAVIGFRDWDNGAESVGGLRFDGSGNVLWIDRNLYDATGNDEISAVQVVSDHKGGAQYVWRRSVTEEPVKDDIYALGVNAQGQPPAPVLYGFFPDAAELRYRGSACHRYDGRQFRLAPEDGLRFPGQLPHRIALRSDRQYDGRLPVSAQ